MTSTMTGHIEGCRECWHCRLEWTLRIILQRPLTNR